jgi:hypothetical protein
VSMAIVNQHSDKGQRAQMSKEIRGGIAPDIFAAVFGQNCDNARYIESDRISFMNAYSSTP